MEKQRQEKMRLNRYTDCLRIAIVPGYHEDERLNSVIHFCKKYGFGNIMLFINAEEYNLGHMTIDEAKPWVESIIRAKRQFEKEKISVSLNPWIELGHLDRGRVLKPGQNFQTMVDMRGKASTIVACPLDRNWREYFQEFYGYLLREIRPEVVWVEDDFRLHNHGDLEYGGCFCPLHLQEYNRRLGTKYSLHEFVERVFSEQGFARERKCWLDVQRDTMSDTAKFIGEIVAEESPGTKVGLMSSTASRHCMEGRDWTTIHENLSKGGVKINRIHLPCYHEISGKEYYSEFNATCTAVRAFLSDDVLIYPELENSAFSSFVKDARFLQFQLESAIPLCIDGMTYDIFDFVGNGAIEKFGYGEAVARMRPYMQGVKDLGLKFSQMKGIVVPIRPDACYFKKHVKNWRDLHPEELDMLSLLSGWGMTYQIRTDCKFERGETIALAGGNSDYFTDEQLKQIFSEQFVILDGETLLKLKEHGLLHLIGANDVSFFEADGGKQSYEQLEEGSIFGIEGYRASAQAKAGDYVRVEYSEEANVQVLTRLFDHYGKFVGDGMVCGKNFLVFPYLVRRNLLEQYNPLRRELTAGIVQKQTSVAVITQSEGIYPYLYQRENGYALILVNATVQNFENIEFDFCGFEVNAVQYINERGKIVPVRYSRNGNHMTVGKKLNYLSTRTLLLNK